MPAKQSELDVNKRLIGRNLSMIEYGGFVSKKSKFQCHANGHQWISSTASVLNGTGCPLCNSYPKLTYEFVKKQLSARGIELLSWGGNSILPAYFKCHKCNHEWKSNLNNVFNGTSCKKCAGLLKRTKEEAQALLNDKKIVIVDYCGSTAKPSLFMCEHGHKWTAPLSSLIQGRGCKQCAEYGFNPAKPATLYIYKIFNNGFCFIGYGISNDYKTRKIKHKSTFKKINASFVEFATFYFENGESALIVENQLKAITKNLKFTNDINGFKTESLPIEFLSNVIDVIANYVK